MSLSTVQQAEGKLLLPTYDRNAILATHGKGVYLYDSEGNKYLDFLSGIGVIGPDKHRHKHSEYIGPDYDH